MALEIRFLKRRMPKVKRENISIKGIKEPGVEFLMDTNRPIEGKHSVMQHHTLSYLKLFIEDVNAFCDVVHSLGYLLDKGKHDPSILPDFLRSPERIIAHAWSAVMVSLSRFIPNHHSYKAT